MSLQSFLNDSRERCFPEYTQACNNASMVWYPSSWIKIDEMLIRCAIEKIDPILSIGLDTLLVGDKLHSTGLALFKTQAARDLKLSAEVFSEDGVTGHAISWCGNVVCIAIDEVSDVLPRDISSITSIYHILLQRNIPTLLYAALSYDAMHTVGSGEIEDCRVNKIVLSYCVVAIMSQVNSVLQLQRTAYAKTLATGRFIGRAGTDHIPTVMYDTMINNLSILHVRCLTEDAFFYGRLNRPHRYPGALLGLILETQGSYYCCYAGFTGSCVKCNTTNATLCHLGCCHLYCEGCVEYYQGLATFGTATSCDKCSQRHDSCLIDRDYNDNAGLYLLKQHLWLLATDVNWNEFMSSWSGDPSDLLSMNVDRVIDNGVIRVSDDSANGARWLMDPVGMALCGFAEGPSTIILRNKSSMRRVSSYNGVDHLIQSGIIRDRSQSSLDWFSNLGVDCMLSKESHTVVEVTDHIGGLKVVSYKRIQEGPRSYTLSTISQVSGPRLTKHLRSADDLFYESGMFTKYLTYCSERHMTPRDHRVILSSGVNVNDATELDMACVVAMTRSTPNLNFDGVSIDFLSSLYFSYVPTPATRRWTEGALSAFRNQCVAALTDPQPGIVLSEEARNKIRGILILGAF